MKKIIFIICLITIIITGLFIFYKKPVDSKTTVQFASWGSESEIKILKPILTDFEKKNPDIKIDFIHIPQNYFQKIHLLFASNTAPDVIFINNQYLPIYAQAGVLEDLTPYKKILKTEKFFPKSIQSLSWNNKLYAIPRDISNLVIFYNKNLFDKYNIEYPKSGWDFKDFLSKANKLTQRPQTFGISFEEEPLLYLPYLISEGFEGIPYYNNVKNNSGLKKYAQLRTKYHVAPTKEEIASMTSAQLFLQGRLGMLLSGRWLVPKFRQEADFDWDVVEFPKMSAGSIVPLDSSGWAISKDSKHKAQALKLIEFISSQESSQKFAKSGLIVPAVINSANSQYFLDNNKPKNAKIFLSVIQTSQPTSVNVDYRKVLDDLKKNTESLFNN